MACYANVPFPQALRVTRVRTPIVRSTNAGSADDSRSYSVRTDNETISPSSLSKQQRGFSSGSISSEGSAPAWRGIDSASKRVFSRLSISPPCVTNPPGGSGRRRVMLNSATAFMRSVTSGLNSHAHPPCSRLYAGSVQRRCLNRGAPFEY